MGFGTVLKLQRYLSRPNLELLERVLRGLTDPHQAAFGGFWRWFGEQPGMTTAQIEHACKSLGDLRLILRDYMTGKG